MDTLLALVDLTLAQFIFCVSAVFIAGMVRGFSGFALSALVMASLVSIVPPVELIAVCWFLELSASMLMVRGGVKQWDKAVVLGLVVTSAIGVPMGLYLTNTVPVDTSRIIALMVILLLAALQLLKVRAGFLATPWGVYVAGFTAGIASGLASVGGMVVALFVLARQAPAQTMRASLVMFLFIGSLTGFIYLYLYGMMNMLSVSRGVMWMPICMTGVIVGQALFRPRLEPYYKPFCLALLMALAAIGLARMGLS